ncbi:MAG: glycine--tRNA ligase subunit beta [Selenomonadaceae bacterium]|nr:glycine--tRNA ligase subunit beta [Selenomonadaceae bacterium]
MTKNFLLEIGTEEIPAHVMPLILVQLKDLAEKYFKGARISAGEFQTLGTPRRISLLVKNVAESQADVEEEKRGPSVKIAVDADGNFTKAAIGFARGQKIAPENLITRDGYIYAVVHESGKKTTEILQTLLPKMICDLTFPNNMHWGSLDFKFIRPIRWLVSLFGDEVIPFEVASVCSGRISRGHRVLSQGEFTVNSADSYVSDCEKNFVIVDQNQRRAMITAQIEAVAKERGGKAEISEELLEEVLYLVEYPTALSGDFEIKYLNLPPEAVITPMRDHQRYFPVKDLDGKLMPIFVTVRNGGRDYLDIVQHGNERVLKARLEDAQFFFNEDRKKNLDEHREKLKTVVFQEGLGSVYEKTQRLVKLSEKIADLLGEKVSADERKNAIRAAEISKADLVTGMVTEFTELQGVMGREYAKLDGENAEVAAAIDEHYMPRFAGDSQPKTTAGKILSLADKIDNIVATFSRGLVPTGSQDPFALRRQALGIVNLLTAANWSIHLSEIVCLAMDLLKVTDKVGREKIQNDFAEFMKLRVKNILSPSTRYDVIDAVIDDVDDIFALTLKAYALEQFLATPDAVKNIQSFVRVGNLAKKAESDEIDEKLITLEAEQVLYKAFEAIEVVAGELIDKKDFIGALDALKKLSAPIDSFFDSVMVMDENLEIRRNRLALLKSVDNLFKKIADFGKLVVI